MGFKTVSKHFLLARLGLLAGVIGAPLHAGVSFPFHLLASALVIATLVGL